METRKIAFACFIGGALCCAVALMVAPAYWWLGILAGIAGGYISYEFREVCRAVPVAFVAAGHGSADLWTSLIGTVRKYVSEPHPFTYLGLACAMIPAIIFTPDLVSDFSKGAKQPRVIEWIFISMMMGIAYAEAVLVVSVPSGILAFIGARKAERCFWVPSTFSPNNPSKEEDLQKWLKEMQSKNYRQMPMTYTNAGRWAAKGLLLTIKFFVWTVWKYLAIGLWATLRFLGKFGWQLFKIIHSEKRVLCAVDGTLGGVISYVWLAPTSVTFSQHLVLVAFGGLLGAGLGVLNWEIVSKRILHLVPAAN